MLFRGIGAQEDPPAWSGIPVITGNTLILPLHVTDTRQIGFGPEWTHVDHQEAEGGDVEYHVFRRFGTTGEFVPALRQSESGEHSHDLR